ncbi:MAG: 1-acyl-sn-glycerol-3-phosphate acyltransferase [Rubrivivax sp.]|nr:1-acyl-sn-glycerol-3-phosphate acyltransferase [Rubrivivax sp.]
MDQRLAAFEITERPVQLNGSALARALLRLLGWRLKWDGLPAAQGVIAVYPHTSNWDFPLALLAKWAVGIQVTWWGKDALFRVPVFGRWLRWLGGHPVVRNAPQGVVGQMIEAMRAAHAEGRFLWLALAPEGTRARAAGWRSGFYRVAHEAGVPLALVVLDFGGREVGFDSCWRVSGDLQADFAVFARRLAGCRGRRPALAAPVRPLTS